MELGRFHVREGGHPSPPWSILRRAKLWSTSDDVRLIRLREQLQRPIHVVTDTSCDTTNLLTLKLKTASGRETTLAFYRAWDRVLKQHPVPEHIAAQEPDMLVVEPTVSQAYP